ncbi:hypothetical protein [Fusobacterium sp. MFO224]|uniref:hypothetical protein n=1 Tax=Fusobacterium sp. MFO224 TaxID=3378070 RepID=UPI003854C08D
MKKILVLLSVIMLTACTSLRNKETQEQKYTEENMKNWEETISKEIESKAYISDLYGDENPIYYLRKTGKMTKKHYDFLKAISTKKEITSEDSEKFQELVDKYVSKLDRKFYLRDNNLKNPKGLVDKMVSDSYLRMKNPSNHIASVVATEEEWEEIVKFSKQKDLNEKDVKKLRKILNKFIKRSEFFDSESWYCAEVSERVEKLATLSKEVKKSKNNINNINAKALYVAYPNDFSPLENWGK